MTNNMKKFLPILVLMAAVFLFPMSAFADGTEADMSKPYLALGADLNESEKASVLDMLGIKDKDLSGYDVVEVTNKQEHAALDNYLSSNVIGSRALSSVLIEKKEAGSGIKVTTKNISYCTTGMYRNALITAGIQDAKVIVAGPFKITGTAGLVGAMNAYEVMTGEKLDSANADAAVDELVTTGEVAESVGDAQKVEELMALIKQQMAENNITSTEDIENVIDEASSKMEVDLSKEDRAKIASLMEKIGDLDLDADSLKDQAKELYDKISNIDLNIDKDGILENVGDFFTKIFDWISNFFSNLFS